MRTLLPCKHKFNSLRVSLLYLKHSSRLRLTRLNEEIGLEEQSTGEGDTYTDVMKDFSRFAVSQPQRLQRNTKIDQSDIATLPASDA